MTAADWACSVRAAPLRILGRLVAGGQERGRVEMWRGSLG
jgi:hypothetical protein